MCVILFFLIEEKITIIDNLKLWKVNIAMASNVDKQTLKDKAESLGLAVSGTKEQLQERLSLHSTVSTLSKEKLLNKAKREGIDLKKDSLKELRIEYCKKKLASPVALPVKSPKKSPPNQVISPKQETQITIVPTSTDSEPWKELVSNLKNQIEGLEEQIDDLENEVETISEEKRKLTEENESLKSLNIEIENLKKALLAKDQMIKERDEVILSNSKKFHNKSLKIKTLKDKIFSLENSTKTSTVCLIDLE